MKEDHRRTRWIGVNVKRNDLILKDYFELGTLEKVGRKYKITRERVRQILEKNGHNPVEIKKAIDDYNYFQKIRKEFKTCKCGRQFILDKRRKERNRLPDLCSPCFLKRVNKLDHYKGQIKWMKTHPERMKTYYKKAGKKYRLTHRKEINKRHRDFYKKNIIRFRLRSKKYYRKNKEWIKQCQSQRRIKSLL
jgi:hypothetical protein